MSEVAKLIDRLMNQIQSLQKENAELKEKIERFRDNFEEAMELRNETFRKYKKLLDALNQN
jgi:predicted  nucleic acid-binding Zn-ribbon protein